jgi:hypothetical protein
MESSSDRFFLSLVLLVLSLSTLFLCAAQTADGAQGTPGSRMPVDGAGPPFFIGEEPVYGQAGGDQHFPAVAFDGTNYLVVWQDGRSTFGYIDIYGTRVSADGTVLDPGGIGIATGLTYKRNPTVAFNGTDYVVVWQEGSLGSSKVRCARVSTGGVVLDPAGISISAASGNQQDPAAASDGTDWLVVWEDNRNGSRDMYGARLAADGSVLDVGGIAISTSAYDQQYPAIAFDGTNYLVVWEDNRNGSRDIYAARVGTDGVVLDADGVAVSISAYDQEYPVAAFDGTNYLVVWEDNRNGSRDIYGARVETGGGVLDAGGIAMSTAAFDQLRPAVAFDGVNYFASWEDNRSGSHDIYGTRIATDGSVLDALGVAISSSADNEWSAVVAFGGASYLVAWHDDRFGFTDIYGARVGTDGGVLDPDGVVISTAAYHQKRPAVAFDGTNYLVVWHDGRPGGDPNFWDIYGARVDAAGTVLDTVGIAICTAPLSQKYPDVAFNGTDYLVVWHDDRSGVSLDIYGARVAVDGTVLDPAGFAVTAAPYDQRYPALSSDGTNCLVVWEDARSGGAYDIYGARIDAAGSVLDPSGLAICTVGADQYHAAAAFSGENYLVVWHDFRDAGGSNIYGARVEADGTLLDPSGIVICTAADGQYVPAVAYNRTNFLVAWHDARDGGYDIYGTRVRVDGSVVDTLGIAVSTVEGNQYEVAMAFNGTDCLLVWEDNRTGSPDIYSTRVDSAGHVLDPAGTPITTEPYTQMAPALAFGLSCTSMIVYESYMTLPMYGCFRIWGNTWSGPTPLTFASASANAQNGHVELFWEMAVEVPVSSFEVQRSDLENGPFSTLDVRVSSESERCFSCSDHSVMPGKSYWYRIVLKGSAAQEVYGPIEVHVSPAPTAGTLYQSYPNPFNPLCTIRYEIAASNRVTLRVFDASGSIVKTLLNAWREPGVYSEKWDGRGEDGRALPSGVYFYQLEAGDVVETHKAVLLR